MKGKLGLSSKCIAHICNLAKIKKKKVNLDCNNLKGPTELFKGAATVPGRGSGEVEWRSRKQ